MITFATSQPLSVCVLGLGRMGAAVATRLADRGHRVVGWTRSGRVVPGIATQADVRAAVADADVVVFCLFDGVACRDVTEQLGDLIAGTTVLNTSTISPGEAAGLAAKLSAAGARYVHAPCIGSVSAISSGTATLLVGGECDDAAAEVLADLGETLELEDSATAASAKLLANGALGGSLVLLGDLRRQAAQLAMDPDRAWTVLERTPPGGVVKRKRQRLDAGTFGDADFTVGALAKDLALLAQSAPGTSGLRDRVDCALESGAVRADDDVAALLAGALPAERRYPHGFTVSPTVAVPTDVLEPLRAYVAGHATGDPAHHRRAFLPSAHVEGVRDGQFVSWTVEDYCAIFTGEPAPDEEHRRRLLDHVQVTGTVGTATMTLLHGASVFTDVFLLVQVDGEWRIANKVYNRATA